MSCNEWKEYRLEDISQIIFSGGTPSTRNEEFWDGDIPWLSSGETRNSFINKTEKTITEEGVKNSSTKLALNGDIVIASAGQGFTRGQVSFCNQDEASYFELEILLNNKYLYYNLKSRYNELRQISDSHSIRGSLTTKMIKDLIIKLPSLEEQEKIANILSSLDDKIELNNEMNKTLEEMAQSIFKRWFVDFEFPNEDGEPYKSSGGEMVDSELGMIPKGWEVKKISELIEVKDGTHASPKVSKEGFPLVTSKHIKGDRIAIEDAKIISEKDYLEVNKRSKVDTGDILISMIGTVGLTYFVQEEEINFAIKNIGLFKTSQNKTLSEYFYLYLKSDNMKNYIEARLAGTTQKYISLGELRNIPVVLPNDSIIDKFKKVVGVLLDKRRLNIINNEELMITRDTLLPKLMNGEIMI